MKIKYNTIKKITMIMLIFTPIIDMLNGMFEIIGLSLPFGQVIRMIFLLISLAIIVIMPKNEFKWKFISIISLFYYVAQIGINYIIDNFPLNNDIGISMKLCLFICMYCCICCCINQKILCRSDIEKVIKFSMKIIPISIFISSILKISFVSYGDSNSGNKGLFIATNSINIVLIILLIFALYFYYKKNGKITDILLNFIALIMIGSKSSFLFLLFILLVIMFFNSTDRIKTVVSTFIIVSIIIIILNVIFKEEIISILERQKYFYDNAVKNNTILTYLLSGRNTFLEVAYNNLINDISIGKVIFGIGSYDMQYKIGYNLGYGILKGIEMDFFDIFFSYGIIGIFASYGVFIYGLKYKIKNKKDRLFINLALVSIFIFSFLGGHTFTEAMPATYMSIVLAFKYCINMEEKYERSCNNSSV